MKTIQTLLAIAVLSSYVCAQAAGSGEFTRKGETTKLPYAYALRQLDHFDPTKIITTVLFSTKPFDTVKVDIANNRMKEAESQLRQPEAHFVELDIGEDGNLETIGFFGPGESISGARQRKHYSLTSMKNASKARFILGPRRKKRAVTVAITI